MVQGKKMWPVDETWLYGAGEEDVTCRLNLAIWSSVRGRVGRMNNISTHSPSYTVPLVLPCTLQRINRWRFATLQYCLFQQCNVKLNMAGKQLPKLIEMSWKHNVAIWWRGRGDLETEPGYMVKRKRERCPGDETWLYGEVNEGELSWKPNLAIMWSESRRVVLETEPGYMVKQKRERWSGDLTWLYGAV